jgi:hypothetical protein
MSRLRAFQAAVLSVTEIACPHCGKKHPWSSGHMGIAMRALRNSPRARRVLVELRQDGGAVTAFP